VRQDHVAVEIVRSPGRVTLRVAGEIDMSTAPSVHEGAVDAIRHHPTLDIDLSAVTFMDSSGLHVLLATRQLAERRGGHVRLMHPTPSVMRVLKVTGVDGMFEIETDDSAATGGT
jgi:anti-sigma B factor antagonist